MEEYIENLFVLDIQHRARTFKTQWIKMHVFFESLSQQLGEDGIVHKMDEVDNTELLTFNDL